MDLFCKNTERLLAVNYFRKNAPSQMFDWVLNTLLEVYQISGQVLNTSLDTPQNLQTSLFKYCKLCTYDGECQTKILIFKRSILSQVYGRISHYKMSLRSKLLYLSFIFVCIMLYITYCPHYYYFNSLILQQLQLYRKTFFNPCLVSTM